jgi:DNA-binding XRE family transcriptional regulator
LLLQKKLCPDHNLVGKPIGPVIRRKSRTPREVFGRAVTELRTQAKVSQATLAASLGYSVYYLGKIEQGKANISCDVMAATARYFGMSIGHLWLYAESHAKKKT